MSRRIHFIVNPRAGRGKAIRAWEMAVQQLRTVERHTGVQMNLSHSWTGETYPVHELPKDTVLACVGGDGSVHHIGKLALQYGLTFAVIPGGTGNDFATMLGLMESPDTPIHTICQGKEKSIDVLRLNDDIALNVAGFGLDAAVVHLVESHAWMKKLGPFGYAVAVPTALTKYRTYSATVTVDGIPMELSDISLCAIANGPSFGGGMRVAPTASCDDGVLDICVVHGLNKLGLLRAFPSIYKGHHISHPNVHMLQGREVVLHFHKAPPQAEYDGEPVPTEPLIHIALLPKHLRVLVPARNFT